MATAVQVEITDELVTATLREVVAERPEYIYSSPEYMGADDSTGGCFYVHKDEDGSLVSAGCVVGTVLHRLGVPLERLVREEGVAAFSLIGKVAPAVSTDVRNKLNAMQMSQDNKKPWGMAYAMATGETI